jgi:hypothetical protein
MAVQYRRLTVPEHLDHLENELKVTGSESPALIPLDKIIEDNRTDYAASTRRAKSGLISK